jgi:hypothetical protein
MWGTIMKFTGFPLFTTITEHTDDHGRPITQTNTHRLTQGWLQTMTQISSIMSGEWSARESFIDADISPSYQKTTLTPYNVTIVAKWSGSGPVTVTFEVALVGLLIVADGSTTTFVQVDGKTCSLPAMSNAMVTGTLLPK